MCRTSISLAGPESAQTGSQLVADLLSPVLVLTNLGVIVARTVQVIRPAR